MTEITPTGALVAAFIKAQSEMTAVIKGAVNPAFKSRYADLASVIDAVLPALNKNGIGLVQSPSFDGEIVTVKTSLLHASGAEIVSELSMRPSKQDPQGVGSAITYARRYALLAVCGVAPEDDDGNAASGPREPAQRFIEPSAVKRLTSSRAKEIGLDAKLKGLVAGAKDDAALDMIEARFDELTAEYPLSWIDSAENMILNRRAELKAEMANEALDAEYKAVMA